MTTPTQMNCAHSPNGWCLACVQALQAEIDARAVQPARPDIAAARTALDDLDDFARMTVGVKATGALKVLTSFIDARAEQVGPSRALVWSTSEGGAEISGPYMVSERVDDKGWNACALFKDERGYVTIALGVPKEAAIAAVEAYAVRSVQVEPVAWRNPMNGAVISDIKKQATSIGDNYPHFSQPLFITPQEAVPAKPLTDERLDELADRNTPNTETGSLNYRNFARDVEDEHGIKAAPNPASWMPSSLST